MKCSEHNCENTVFYIRHTQFAGDHPFCQQHAKEQSDFESNNSSVYWESLSAEKINLNIQKPLTDNELRDIKEKVEKGSLVILRRPPWPCLCGERAMRNLRYIGDIDDVAEWEVTCDKCGNKLYA